MQVPTVLSLLTPEYQKRVVQETYHHGHTNKPMWPSQYCWPEGFMRRWHEWAAYDRQVMVTPKLVQIYGSGRDELRHQHPRGARVQDGRPRAAARRERAALVRRDDRLLGRGHADHVDLEHPGVGLAHGLRALEPDAVDRDLHADARRDGQVLGAQPRGDPLRPRGARRTDPHHPAPHEARRVRRCERQSHRLHRVHPDDLSRRGHGHAAHAGTQVRVRSAGHVRAPVGAHLGDSTGNSGMEKPDADDLFDFN